MTTTEGTTMKDANVSATKRTTTDKGFEVWAAGKHRKTLPTLDQARAYATWIRHHEGLDTAVRRQP